jgi:NRPS condensation-like uncharacterized protein
MRSTSEIKDRFRIPAPALDQFNYAVCISPGINSQEMHFVIVFEEHLDPDRLRAAYEFLLMQVPVLRSRFVECESPYWEEIPDLVPAESVRIIQSEDPEKTLQQVMREKIDPATGPQAILSLVRDPKKDTLCLTFQHTAADGHGMIACAILLAEGYRNPTPPQPEYAEWDNDRSLLPILSSIDEEVRLAMPFQDYHMPAGFRFPFIWIRDNKKGYRIRVLPDTILPAVKEI